MGSQITNIDVSKKIHNWYFEPGEIIRSIGFIINPYKCYDLAKFRHVFSFDGDYNLYVGQYSVYYKHIDSIFDLKDKREFGMIFPVDSVIEPTSEGSGGLCKRAPVVELAGHEAKNIIYFNKRLRPIAQRLFDYGLPKETFIVSKLTDLWHLTIKNILKDKYLERPSPNQKQENS